MRMKMIVETLHAMYAALCNKENWVQHCSAKSESGVSVDIDSPYACAFCLTGALAAAQRGLGYSINDRAAVRGLIAFAITREFPLFHKSEHGAVDIIGFNDGTLRHHSHIVRVVERAIALAESRLRLTELEQEVRARYAIRGFA